MKLIEIANAGTLESSDIQIIIEPNENGGIVIELESVVKAQFGEQVEDVITNTLKELGVTDEFLNEAIDYYKSKYGQYYIIDRYMIRFIPSFGICELF